MNLIKCDHEHFYDGDKFDTCPHCANEKAVVKNELLNKIDILGKEQKDVDTAIPNATSKQEYEHMDHKEVVGWLVCILGDMRGDSFCLYAGENHIGRSAHMDVSLFKEASVSRENHALLNYDSKQNTFTFKKGNASQNPVLHNQKKLKKDSSVELQERDHITLGECELVFVPFCNAAFDWNK